MAKEKKLTQIESVLFEKISKNILIEIIDLVIQFVKGKKVRKIFGEKRRVNWNYKYKCFTKKEESSVAYVRACVLVYCMRKVGVCMRD